MVGKEGLPAERERATDQRPVPADDPVGSDLEVGPAELAFDLLVALLDPVAQPVQAHHLGQVGLLGAAAGGAGRGRLVSRYQLLWPGSLAGSVLATTSRSRRSGPQPRSCASAAHQVSLWPSRKRRWMRRHCPGRFGLRQPSSPAASTGVWACSAGAQVPLRGLRASTNGTLAATSALVKPGLSP